MYRIQKETNMIPQGTIFSSSHPGQFKFDNCGLRPYDATKWFPTIERFDKQYACYSIINQLRSCRRLVQQVDHTAFDNYRHDFQRMKDQVKKTTTQSKLIISL